MTSKLFLYITFFVEKLAAAFVSDAQWIIKSILLNFFKEFFFVKSIGKKLIFLLFL